MTQNDQLAEMASEPLKAPFPYFGGKALIAAEVWAAFGEVRNYVEPFAGSLAVLLNRPAPRIGPETINDLDCHLINAWRAITREPTVLAPLLVAPAAEVETEAQHNALVRASTGLRASLADPAWCCVESAAWWIKGANEWIGTGWCSGEGPWSWTIETGWEKINRQLPHVGDAGRGINRKLPHVGDAGKGNFQARVEWVEGWLTALQDRLCQVRIACGDWKRVLGESTTIKHGITAVFMDPPYQGTEYVYGSTESVSNEVRAWCAVNGGHSALRIILAGRGDEHDDLIDHGWSVHRWTARKGYSNSDLHGTETLWLSPNCILAEASIPDQLDLFTL